MALVLIYCFNPLPMLSAKPSDYQVSGSADQLAGREVERWVEEWDPYTRQWKRIKNRNAVESFHTQRQKVARQDHRGPRFGPFIVQNETVAAIIARTDRRSLEHFERMLAAYPSIEVLSFVDAPGTIDDIANLQLGRQIRARGLTTKVPAYGSVRSGAVELFLAGVRYLVEPGASFAVHSWRDNYGRGPRDLPESHPSNQVYVDYYTEMGMSLSRARAFYRMTNSVPFDSALWLDAKNMEKWLLPTSRR